MPSTSSAHRRLAVLAGHAAPTVLLPGACAAKPKRRVAVIGAGICGTAAMKAVVDEGMEAVCFEKKDHIGGFWQYNEDPQFPCVYGCTHIDSKRDHNSFGTVPCTKEMPQVMDHRDVIDYLKKNHEEYRLERYIRFRHEVTWITDAKEDQETGLKRWRIDYVDAAGEAHSEVFEGVMICSGRHSRARLPVYEGMDVFKGFQVHTNRYKDYQAHGLEGKRVVVVGVGNSGNDMVSELAPRAEKLWWVCRRGTWIYEAEGNPSKLIGDERVLFGARLKVPWQIATRSIEKGMLERQKLLNEAGLQPDHHILSAHPSQTGMARGTPQDRGANGHPVKRDVPPIHDLCGSGLITGKRGIERITESTVVFTDGEEVECDAIIWATGFKQAVEFLDPAIVNMTYDREDAEVADKLYYYCWPMSPGCSSLSFIAFCQSFTFMCADLQTRLGTSYISGRIKPPSPETMRAEMEAMDGSLKSQFTASPRHAIQGATRMEYYDNLAKMLGCYPSPWKVLTERPLALRTAFFTPWSCMIYRLVGHGATPDAVRVIDEQVRSTRQSIGESALLNAGPWGNWPNSQYFKELFRTISMVRDLEKQGFDGDSLPRPAYLASEHRYGTGENVTKEQNAGVWGSRSEQVAKKVTIRAQSGEFDEVATTLPEARL
jgi:dimethylaniline monooxygenase (N-oxide forming)